MTSTPTQSDPKDQNLTEFKATDLKETAPNRADSAVSTHGSAGDTQSDSQAFQPRPPHRRWPLMVGGSLVLVLGVILGWRWWQFQQTHVSTDNAQIQGHLSPVSAQITATVQQVQVQAGDYVKAGQPLVVLEDQDLQLKVQAAEAALSNAQAQLASATDTVSLTQQTQPAQEQQAQANLAAKTSAIDAAQAAVAQAQAQIATRQAAVTQAQTQVHQTETDYHRYQSLYQAGAISAQQFDSARSSYDNAQASLTAAQQAVRQAQAELASAQAQRQTSLAEAKAAQEQVRETQASAQTVTVKQDQQAQAQAQVKQAQADLDLARQQLTYTVIPAPVSGYVGQLTAQVGQKVQPGQPLLAVVPLQTDRVYVEANFKETALGRIQLGESAAVKVDAYPGQTFPAVVEGISPATGSSFALIPPDNATGNFNKVVQWVPVRLVFAANADPEHKLRPGLNVTVTVDTHASDAAAPSAPNP